MATVTEPSASLGSSSEKTYVHDALLEDQLVELWADYPCLFDVRAPSFKNRDCREAALSEIAQKLEQTVDWVKSKIRALRNAYTKAKKLPSSGSSRKGNKRTKWLLDKLQFLSPFIATRTSVSNLSAQLPDESASVVGDLTHMDTDDEEESFDEVVYNGKQKDVTEPRVQPSRKKTGDEELQIMRGILESVQQRTKKQNKNNALEKFGSYIVQSLEGLDPKMRNTAQFHINTILFQAQMGTLSHYPNSHMHSPWHSQPWHQQQHDPYPSQLFSQPGPSETIMQL